MLICPSPKSSTQIAAIVAAGLSCLALANPCAAQDNGFSESPQYASASPEEVIVRPRPTRNTIGAPMEDITLSQAVSYSDLDLPTVEGNIAFRHRVSDAAYSVCNRLEMRYPVGAPDKDGCYRAAMRRVTPQVDEAIHTHPVSFVTQQP